MEPDFKLIDRIPNEKYDEYIRFTKLLILNPDSNILSKDLPLADRIIITKLFKVLRALCKTPKKGLLQIIDKLDRKENIKEILGQLHFSRTINNYQLIKAHFNKEKIPNDFSRIKVAGTSEVGSDICVNFEYRIEVTLSSHKAKKVLRPLILLIFTMEDDRVISFYVDINQFQQIRKHAALGMKTLHQIESKG